MIIDATNKTSDKIIDLTNNEQKPHESKPVRALLSNVGAGVTSDLAGIAVGAVTLPVSLGEYAVRKIKGDEQAGAKTLANNPGINILTKGREVWNNITGANPEEERDRSERIAGFVGDMIPTLGTGGMYGIAKAPTKTISKALLKIPNKNARNITKNVSEYLLPGMQIPKTSKLVEQNLAKGLNSVDALKKARQTQLISGGIQGLGSLGLQEGIGYATNNIGVIGDYRDEPEDFSLEQEVNDRKSMSFMPLAMTAVGAVVGYKGLSKLTAANKEKILKRNELAQSIRDQARQYSPTKNMTAGFRANVLDKNLIWEKPELSYLVDDTTRDFITQDMPTTIGAMYKTGDFGHGVHSNTSPYSIAKQLDDLRNSKEATDKIIYEQVEDLLELENKIQNLTHQIATGGKVGSYVDYESLPTSDIIISSKASPTLLDSIRQHKILLKNLQGNQKARQILDAISENDKALLELQYKSGRMSEPVYKYLLQNRTVNGHFSYKPAIPLSEETGLLTKAYKKLKQVMSGSDDYVTRGELSGAYRKDFDFDKKLVPYLDSFKGKTINTLQEATKNSMLKMALPRMLENQKPLYDYFDAQFEKATKGFFAPKDPTAKRKLAQGIFKQANDAMRIKYLGEIEPYKQVYTNNTNPLSIINKPFAQEESVTARFIRRKTDTSENRLKDIVRGIKSKDNKNYLTYWDNGKIKVFETSELIKSTLDFAPETASILQNVMKGTKRFAQATSTGNLNPAFAPVSYMYSVVEGLTALPKITKELGMDYKVIGDSLNYVKSTIRAAKERNAITKATQIVDRINEELVSGITDPKALDALKAQKEVAVNKLNNILLQRADRLGATTFKYDNDFAGNTYNLSVHAKVSEQLYNAINKKFGENAEQALKFVNFMQETLRNAGNDGLLLHFAGKKGVSSLNDKEIREIAGTISKYITDSKKTGLYRGLPGEICGIISNYVPYGRVMISSIGAKLEAMNVKGGMDFIKNAYTTIKGNRLIQGSQKKGIDILTELQIGTEYLKDNKFLQGLLLTAGLPAVACYVWNHSNEENRTSYYSLSDYDKSSKYILTNFLGKDNHLSIPVDQEVMIFGKMTEALLDSFIGGSQLQNIDPAFDNNRMMLLALQRSLNIENLIPVEAAMNLAGYRTNFGPSNFTGEALISPLPPNQTNLDGSKTTIQNGVFSQEGKAFINTMFGSIGNALTNGIEQAKIGTRDVGIGQGLEDFVKGTTKPLFKNVPFVPVGGKFTFTGANQTQKSNKLRQNTIEQLRKLRSYVKNDNNATFGRRKEGKVANDAMTQGLSPALQNALSVADVAVPYYNQNILPLYDKISATYKQIAAYNSSGRDVNGNIIDAGDRFTYQQNKNLEIQQIHGQIFDHFKKLEQLLTNQFNRDITLDSYDKLKG